MTLSELSIRRPVLAIVTGLLIITIGIGAMFSIPVRELPDIDTATVTVATDYPGAPPEVVDTDITLVIETAISGVSGIKQISSTNRRGRSRTVIEFETGVDVDQAANDVRDAVGRVRAALPEEAEEPVVIKSDSDADPVMRLAVASDRHSPQEITDYVIRFVVDRLSTINGVASVDVRGERRYAIRIWIDRRALAARNLTVADIEQAIRLNNVERPTGEVESNSRLLEIRLDSRLSDVDAFRSIVLGEQDGVPIRLADVARVEQGVENDDIIVRANGDNAVGMQVLRQSQSNTMEISDAIRAEVYRIQEVMPDGMRMIIGSDDALFIRASIQEVLTALAMSLGLVVLVILLFLRSIRTTLVPIVTIPVALIGCLAMIAGMGFSINVLTLLALLLAIGLVVDDAIVVLENIKRRIDNGETPMVAAVRGTRQVTFAVLATSITLIAVFIPISFMGGQVGRLFSEFGLVMAAAVVISTYVALSLCPMIASRILSARKSRPDEDAMTPDERLAQSFVGRVYGRALSGAIGAPLVVFALCAAFVGGAGYLYQDLTQELAPREDRGVAFIPMVAPQGANVAYTDGQVSRVEQDLQPFLEDGTFETVYAIVGPGNRPFRGFIVMRMAPWDQRDETAAEIVRKVRPTTRNATGARAFVVTPAGLGLRGSSSPLRIVVGGANFEDVQRWAAELLAHAEDNPNLINPEMDFEENQPQLDVSLDRRRLDDLEISADDVASTLQSLFASREISTYIDRGREYPVIVQAQEQDRAAPTDIENLFIRTGSGTLVPLDSVISITETAASAELRRFDRLPAITISAALTADYALGEAIAYMEEGAAEIIAEGAQLGYSGQSAVFKDTSSDVVFLFLVALLIAYLVLAAQFESFVHPFVVMLSVPLALAGAVYALWVADVSLNVYSQIGIVLLIGLMAKNGILIVEFANQLRDAGRSVKDAVTHAAMLRFRPIIMTVISTVLGAVPLVLASGAGAESRMAIGVVIVGGLGLSLFLTLFLTPVLYSLLAGYTAPCSLVERSLNEQLADAKPEALTPQPAE